MAKKKNPLTTVGIDLSARLVVGGLFKMAGTLGFPLSFSLDYCESHGLTPGLGNYIDDALRAGRPEHRIMQRLREGFADSGRSGTWPEVEQKVRAYLNKQ